MKEKDPGMEISESFSRRQFLKTAALGALGGLLWDQHAIAASSSSKSDKIMSLVGLVDIAQTLADRDVSQNIYWIDNNRFGGSKNEGTSSLQTKVRTGDIIKWVVVGLEVETSVVIEDIAGPIWSVVSPFKDKTSPFGGWTGVVKPGVRGVFPYNVNLLVEGISMPMELSLSLEVV